MITKTALERGQEMMNMKMNHIPVVARDHLEYISRQIGMCMEVCLTVYTIYAQIVEDLPCDDELYIPDNDAISWYKNRGFEYKKKTKQIMSKMEWISVNERLPEKDGSYLVWAPTSFPKNSHCVVAEFYMDNNKFYSESVESVMPDVTHWCCLPEEPN